MPYDVTTPFGTHHGVMTPEEEWGYRQQMANQQLAAQAQIAALNNQTQQNIAGTFGQRSAADLQRQELLGQQRMGEIGAQGDQNVRAITAGQAPEMGRLGMEQQLFQEGAPLRAAESQGRIGKLNFQNEINGQVRDLLRGKVAGGGAALPSPDEMYGLQGLMSLANGGSMPDPVQHQLALLQFQGAKEGSARSKAQSYLDSGQVAEAKAAAAEGGVALPLPQVEDYEAKNPTFGSDLSALAGDFATKDASVIGWNPTDADVQQIINERDRTAQILLNHGYDQATAIREANRKIMMNPAILAHKNDVNAGWIQKLMARLQGG